MAKRWLGSAYAPEPAVSTLPIACASPAASGRTWKRPSASSAFRAGSAVRGPYFICPGVANGIACGRRVAKLHGPDRYFLCRHCYRLAHASQSESEWDRILRRANKIRRRLGGEPGLASRFPDRPKGMWKRTYERLQDEVIDAEVLAEEVFEIQAQRLLARIDRPSGK